MEADGAQGAKLGTDTGKQEQAKEEGRFSFFKSSRFIHACVSHFTQDPDTCPEQKRLYKIHLTW